MNLSQRLRTCAKHTGLDAVIELLQEAADEIDALQARAQVQGEPVAWLRKTDITEIVDSEPESDGWTPLYTTPQPAQATPSIPSDGPSTYEQRFTAAVAVICGVTPPAALVCDWINKAERHDDLQQWVGSYAPGWVQNIAVLDAAHQMADQPTEGGDHEPAQQATQAEVTDATIDAATRHIYHNGRPTSKEYRVGIARAILALRPQQSGLTGCNCRWDGDTQVQWCELHLAHKEAIHEWAERAKEAEKQLSLRPERVPMTPASRDVIMATRTANADADEWPEPWAYQRGWNDAEAHHGIKAHD